MAEVLLFHHVQGLTPGVTAFADALRGAGHTVHTLDMFEGRTLATIPEGMAFARELGFDTIEARSLAAADGLPAALVYAGMSLGVMAAQQLVQNRPGAKGALLLYSCIDPAEFGSWPDGVPVQIHGMDSDPFFAGEGDIDAARKLVDDVTDAELFVYPGSAHLFADSSLPEYDAAAATLLTERVVAFLATV
jgi:dienelactone hydrolase